MSDVLTKDLVVVSGSARTREDAIREAGGLLVASGAVTPEYVDAMAERERASAPLVSSWVNWRARCSAWVREPSSDEEAPYMSWLISSALPVSRSNVSLSCS